MPFNINVKMNTGIWGADIQKKFAILYLHESYLIKVSSKLISTN